MESGLRAYRVYEAYRVYRALCNELRCYACFFCWGPFGGNVVQRNAGDSVAGENSSGDDVEMWPLRVQRTQQLGTRVWESSYVGYVGYYFGQYMIIRHLDP